ncbi:universal stress protein [Oricola indica]|uniref:universal stress protein n=1 Tax=Oricola indica TaxID=2872591 RepID=UPI001CBE83F0|nr:universal stress protein [Oricola indica]
MRSEQSREAEVSYQNILAHLEFDGRSDNRLNYATDLAGELDSYLIGFTATALRPVHVSDMEVAADQAYRDEADGLNVRRFNDLRQQFMDVAGDGQNSGWRQSQDLPTKALLLHARAADLVVSGTPQGASPGDSYRAVDPGELVCNAGRPVLFVGERSEFRHPSLTIIGWKDTPQARRAVSSALPFLHLSDTVMVLSIGEDHGDVDDSGARDVVRYLLRHGIAAEAQAITARNASEAFIDAAHARHADLVVAGAFGHSRLRERVFGGFTYALLMQSDLNRLMVG